MSAFDPNETPLLGYIVKFKDGAKEGPVAQLYYEDTPEGRQKADEYARRIDEPGHSVYSCIGRLRCRPRNKDNVAELEAVVQDIDLRNVVETREQVLERLHSLPLQPYEIRDSGGGLHPKWRLREPLTDEAGMAQAEAAMKRLTRLLAADPAPTHRAALLRHPGTHNTRYGESRECKVIERSGNQCDISEFDDMFDLYGDTPLLHYKEKSGNGHDPGGLEPDGEKTPVDVGSRLAAMQYEGPGDSSVHRTQLSCTASLLRAGCTVDHAVEEVLEATRKAVTGDKRAAEWDWVQERRAVFGMCVDFINKNPELCILLPDALRERWDQALADGKRPKVFPSRRFGWHVRAFELKDNAGPRECAAGAADEQASAGKEETVTEKPQESAPRGRIYPKPFACFDFAKIPQREWLYGGHYMRSIASATIGPGGSGKSSLDLVESVAMATGRNLLGEQPTERLRVWYHNGEDPLQELERRIAAICVYYRIDPHELDGYFYCTSGLEMPIKIAGGNGEVKLNHATAGAIIIGIREREIDVLTLDPLITLHSLAEAENHKMDPVLREFARVANDTNCAIELAHHTRKKVSGQEDYTTADARGASAIIDAVRSARTLNGLNNDDAKLLGIDDDIERLSFFRVDKGKANMTRRTAASYYRLVGQELPNGLAGGPGDDVGVVTRVTPPDADIKLSEADVAFLVAETANSDQAEKVQSENWFGRTIAERLGLDVETSLGRAKVENVIRNLIRGKHVRCVSRKGRHTADRHRRNLYVPTDE